MPDMLKTPDRRALSEAHNRIRPFINKTPVLTCSTLNRMLGAELFFKCENFQKVGAFKMRGASNAVLSLSPEEAKNGVATHSSGNHAQALALAARNRGIPAYIVMPSNAPKVKVAAVKDYGAEIIFCEPTLQARENTLESVVAATGATFVHPYNDYRIIAGQATASMELLEEVGDLDVVMTPVGGGGLMSGTALALHYFSPKTLMIAAEPQNANDAYLSFQQKKLIPSLNPQTQCDGLLTSLGEKTFQIMLQHVAGVALAREDSITEAMRLTWERMKIIIEPSSAVPLATLLEKTIQKTVPDLWKIGIKTRIGIIVSGGNLDLGVVFND